MRTDATGRRAGPATSGAGSPPAPGAAAGTLLRLVPRFSREAWRRALVALGAGALATLPLVALLRAGSPTGAAGAAGANAALASVMEPALSLSMALAAVLLAAGSVSEPLGNGWCRTALVRPVWRPGWFLARLAGALAWCPACGLALHAAVDLLSGPGRLPLGAASTVPGALAWSAAAAPPTFALSCLLRRGDGLAAAALLLLPGLVATLGDPAGRPFLAALAAVAPPVAAAREILGAGLAGSAPAAGRVLVVAAHGSAWLLLGTALLSRRPLAPE